MKKILIIYLIIIINLLSSCTFNSTADTMTKTNDSQFDDDEVYLDESAPIIEFTPVKHTDDGIPEYYLFDDNPEHLNPKFLADSENPNAIAHFENLAPGVYTVFSYHHRGDSVASDADLYYDTVFSSNNNAEFEILAIGLDHDWNWNQTWADYTNSQVFSPEYVKSFDCLCKNNCVCFAGEEICSIENCPAIIRNEIFYPNTESFDNLNTPIDISADAPVFLSDHIKYIYENDINHFRYGGYNEPMWLMMKFKVISGRMNFDTIAYQDKEKALENIKSGLKAPFDNEPQYKGTAYNAPVVISEFDYTIDDATPNGAVPVTVKNQRVPDGFTIRDGVFATNVNTWREKYPIAAESDIMMLEYTDDTKIGLYGENINDRSNIWRFDPFHTKTYSNNYTPKEKNLLNIFNIRTDENFEPNEKMEFVIHPVGNETASDDFYKYTACNLGNFGVTTKYKINVRNVSSADKKFIFDMKSIAGQVYKFKQTSPDGNILYSDEGMYYMKKFDYDPAEDPESTSEPKARIEPPEHSSIISFDIEKNTESLIEIEITTLTGCTAPMHNKMSIETIA